MVQATTGDDNHPHAQPPLSAPTDEDELPRAHRSKAPKAELLVPPINFSLVVPGIYRSGHPNKKNHGFLRTLHLKSIMYIIGTDPYRPDSQSFIDSSSSRIKLYRTDLSSEPSLFTPPGHAALSTALHTLLDPSNHPILVHDDTGKSATSLVVALIRTIQGWSLTGVWAEGDLFAGESGGGEGSGVGEAGREFIAMFDPRQITWPRGIKPSWAV